MCMYVDTPPLTSQLTRLLHLAMLRYIGVQFLLATLLQLWFYPACFQQTIPIALNPTTSNASCPSAALLASLNAKVQGILLNLSLINSRPGDCMWRYQLDQGSLSEHDRS